MNLNEIKKVVLCYINNMELGDTFYNDAKEDFEIFFRSYWYGHTYTYFKTWRDAIASSLGFDCPDVEVLTSVEMQELESVLLAHIKKMQEEYDAEKKEMLKMTNLEIA